MERIIAYIDGFNLYFGLKSKGWKRYYWLNIPLLIKNLLKEDQNLIGVKYFTSRIKSPPGKVKRQSTFIEALETEKEIEIFYGKYYENPRECKVCGNISPNSSEKMTDVNIAVELLSDAYQDNFDSAMLISADSDLVAPIKKVKELFPNKRILVAFPPDRFSYELSKISSASFTIGRKKLADSLFPDDVVKEKGYILKRPEEWK
jgi:uncharacterized LabA/DUF88 family protein